MVENVALLAFVQASPEGQAVDPAWLRGALTHAWPEYRGPAEDDRGEVRAWSVGGVQGTETLVQSRPVVRDPRGDFVADCLRAPSPATLAAYHSRSRDADHGPSPRLNVARYQRWIGVRAEDLEDAATPAESLRKRLPDFLARSLGQAGDRELSVFGFLAALHHSGDLHKPYAPPAQVRRALAALDEELGRPARINLLVTDGRTLGVLHRGGRLVQLDAPPPPRPQRAFAHAPRSHATLFLYAPEPGPRLPEAFRLVPDGVYSVSARQPDVLEQGVPA